MSYYDQLLALTGGHPFSLTRDDKRRIFVELLNELSSHHLERCPEYRRILKSFGSKISAGALEDVPFLPVRLFKHLDLLSVPKAEIFKTLTSSGTTGQQVSKIYLSRENALIQAKVLSAIITHFLGKNRLPMVIIDSDDILKDRTRFSARAAAVLGFSSYGKDHFYALDSSLQLQRDDLELYVSRKKSQGIFIFGFTFLIWKHLVACLESQGRSIDFGGSSVVLHGGGWKKLVDLSVPSEEFKRRLSIRTGVQKIHDYYGMVEQTGSIFVECEYGHLHASNFSDVIVRDPVSFAPCQVGEVGLLQLISLLPYSYPGHSLLSEDLGALVGEDDCRCGRMGKYFYVQGRMKTADLRGCSDTRIGA